MKHIIQRAVSFSSLSTVLCHSWLALKSISHDILICYGRRRQWRQTDYFTPCACTHGVTRATSLTVLGSRFDSFLLTHWSWHQHVVCPAGKCGMWCNLISYAVHVHVCIECTFKIVITRLLQLRLDLASSPGPFQLFNVAYWKPGDEARLDSDFMTACCVSSCGKL